MGVEVTVRVGVVVGDEVSVGVIVGDGVSVGVGTGDGVSVGVNNSVFVGTAPCDGMAVGDRVSVAVHVGVPSVNCIGGKGTSVLVLDDVASTSTVALGVSGGASGDRNNRTAANSPANNTTINKPNNGVIWGIAIKGFLLVDARTPVGNSAAISCRGSITGSALAG